MDLRRNGMMYFVASEIVELSLLGRCRDRNRDDNPYVAPEEPAIRFEVVASEPTGLAAPQTTPVTLTDGAFQQVQIRLDDFGVSGEGVPVRIAFQNVLTTGACHVSAFSRLSSTATGHTTGVASAYELVEGDATVGGPGTALVSRGLIRRPLWSFVVTGDTNEDFEYAFSAQCPSPTEESGPAARVAFDVRFHEVSGECEDIVQSFSLGDGEYASARVPFIKAFMNRRNDQLRPCSDTPEQAVYSVTVENLTPPTACHVRGVSRLVNRTSGETAAGEIDMGSFLN
ncbi:hypothetical protein [Marinobacter sp. F4216]|uniref:hypothetical protein n=1 Tax=Marinobacter sp. F4216 TaxID=2874281 RepID=UPI001CBC8EED|nr:hypothetical protein [Marinobacter sp. F4216]MBZ2168126.1 hypothetical protein [Marinobacter sp. F4216]